MHILETRLGHVTEIGQQAATEFADKVRQQYREQALTILLFGSIARGEAEDDSDIDVLVVMSEVSPETRRSVRFLAVEVWLKYGIYVSTRVWSRSHWQKLEEMQTLLYQNIVRDGIGL